MKHLHQKCLLQPKQASRPGAKLFGRGDSFGSLVKYTDPFPE